MKPMTPRPVIGAPLVLISVDGLYPDFYLSSRSEHVSEALADLASRGAYARSVEPVRPTVTYTNHATLVTGTYPDRHGILSNTRFSPDRVTEWKDGESQDWYFKARSLRAPPLWRIASEAGKKTALLHWPVSVGAKTDHLLAEIFPTDDREERNTWNSVRQNSTPSLIQWIENSPDFKEPHSHADMDEIICTTACHLLENQAPDLLMLHFSDFDHQSHENGRGSPEASRAMNRIIGKIQRIMSRIDFGHRGVFIFGDHGFLNFDRRLHINALFEKYGWLAVEDSRIVSWQVIAHVCCAQAPIFVRDPRLSASVLETLKKEASEYCRVLEVSELRSLHALPPHCIAVIEAKPGFSLGRRLKGAPLEKIPHPRGEHGYSPSNPGIQAGFIALGPGIPEGLDLGHLRSIDIAPTAAAFLGVPLENADGTEINLFGPGLEQRQSSDKSGA